MRKKTNNNSHAHLPWILLVLSIVLLALLCSLFFYQLLLIQGDSMLPSYHHLQLVVLEKWRDSYTYGDVIAFSCETLEMRTVTLVKRVVAIPGDTVQIKDGTLYINGTISNVFAQTGIFTEAGIAASPITLDANTYFVIGDNVSVSKDSRVAEIGTVTSAHILGRVIGS